MNLVQRLLILVSLILATSCATCATARPAPGSTKAGRYLSSVLAPAINKDRHVEISGVIQGGNILRLTPQLMKWANDGTGQPIDIMINSPGGEVTTGFLFVNVMETIRGKGVHLRCFVPGIAASMAFQILVHCDERYALSRAFLLWHRVRVSLGGGLFGGGVTMTAPVARELAVDLQSLDTLIFRELNDTLGLPKDVVSYHFERETLHVAEDLARLAPDFLQAYPYIDGLMEMASDPKGKSSEDKSQFKAGEIVYIWNGRQ